MQHFFMLRFSANIEDLSKLALVSKMHYSFIAWDHTQVYDDQSTYRIKENNLWR